MHILIIWAFLILICNSQFDRSGCGNLKGCITMPIGCIQTGTCRLYFSYLQDADYLVMEIFGQQNPTMATQYYAIGFSTDMYMGDDTVVFCRSVNGVTQAGLAYNGPSRGSVEIMNANNIQVVSQASVSSGGIYCLLRQRLYAGAQNVKNLNGSYYILAATGTVQGDGRLSYHNGDRSILSLVDLRQYVKVGNNVVVNPITGTAVQPFSLQRPLKDWMKIIHAILMLFSWGLFLSTGILFARHFKNHWPQSKFCGVQLWFAYHRTLNILGLVLSILGVLAILFALDWSWQGPQLGWSSVENLSVGPLHCLFGSIACVIGWLQPINALCRCKTDSSARFIFNWLHRLFGLIGFLGSMAAITLAAFKFNTMFLSMDAATSIWSAYLAILIVCELILETLKIKRWCANTTVVTSEKAKEDGSIQIAPPSGFSNAQSYVLFFFFLVEFCLIFALSALIFMKPVRS